MGQETPKYKRGTSRDDGGACGERWRFAAQNGRCDPPQGLPVDQVGGVELAAAQQQADAVVVVAGGDDLVGPLELAGGDAAVLRVGRR